MEKLIIVGAGDVGSFLAHNDDLFGAEYEKIGILDDDPKKRGAEFNGWPVLGSISQIKRFAGKNLSVVLGIADPGTKRKIVGRLREFRVRFPSFVAKNAWLSKGVRVRSGAIVYPGVAINHGTIIDEFSLINFNCAIGHDVSIGKFSFLAPGVNLGGFTVIEDGAKLGIGASTKQNIRVGKNAEVGGMCMVTTDVLPGTVCCGVPGRQIRRKGQ